MTIDLWDHRTYDAEITGWLSDRKELITGYYHDERKKDAEIAERDRWEPLQPNPYSADFMAAREELGALMAKKTLRVFHYTRMSDSEIGALSADGIVPTSLEFLKARIVRQVEQGFLTREQGETIFANSPSTRQAMVYEKGSGRPRRRYIQATTESDCWSAVGAASPPIGFFPETGIRP